MGPLRVLIFQPLMVMPLVVTPWARGCPWCAGGAGGGPPALPPPGLTHAVSAPRSCCTMAAELCFAWVVEARMPSYGSPWTQNTALGARSKGFTAASRLIRSSGSSRRLGRSQRPFTAPASSGTGRDSEPTSQASRVADHLVAPFSASRRRVASACRPVEVQAACHCRRPRGSSGPPARAPLLSARSAPSHPQPRQARRWLRQGPRQRLARRAR